MKHSENDLKIASSSKNPNQNGRPKGMLAEGPFGMKHITKGLEGTKWKYKPCYDKAVKLLVELGKMENV